MANLQQIQNIAAQIHLTLDNVSSVKRQLQTINQAQQQLRQIKQEVSTKLQEVHQESNAFGIDEAASIGLHLLGEHRLAQQVNRRGNMVERRKKNNVQQPLIRMRNLIDNYLFEGDRLKTIADNYLQNQESK